MAQEDTISPNTENSANGLWLLHHIFPLYGLCVCTRAKLADFAQTQMQLMEVTVCFTVSDEIAGS